MSRENVVELSVDRKATVFMPEVVERVVVAAVNRTVHALGKQAVAMAVCLRDEKIERQAA